MVPSKYTILVVDDEELMRRLMASFLSKLGHLYETAIDGFDALDKMSRIKFDAVITDIKMPRMDGLILTREISKKYSGIPIMVMTGFAEEYTAKAAISMGAKEFINKPFSLSEFVMKLHNLIQISEPIRQMETGEDEEGNIHELKDELDEILKKS